MQTLLWPCSADGSFPTPVLHPGTLCLTVTRTLILLCQPSNAILGSSSFAHTARFDVSYENALLLLGLLLLLFFITHIRQHTSTQTRTANS